MTERMIARGRWLIVDCETFVENGAVLVEGETIAEVGAWADLRSRHPEAKVIGSDTAAVLPGLINAHHHSAGATA
ncbi:MAG: cytosine deaminase, partial [Alphaproteobacteria bacterium]